jgi:hypothetical protein
METTGHYQCKHEALPLIETALVANGYTIAIPWQKNLQGTTALVMRRGAAALLLAYDPRRNLAEIELWDQHESAVARLLESYIAEQSNSPFQRAYS